MEPAAPPGGSEMKFGKSGYTVLEMCTGIGLVALAIALALLAVAGVLGFALRTFMWAAGLG